MPLGLLANELRSNADLHRIVVADKGADLLASRWTYGASASRWCSMLQRKLSVRWIMFFVRQLVYDHREAS